MLGTHTCTRATQKHTHKHTRPATSCDISGDLDGSMTGVKVSDHISGAHDNPHRSAADVRHSVRARAHSTRACVCVWVMMAHTRRAAAAMRPDNTGPCTPKLLRTRAARADRHVRTRSAAHSPNLSRGGDGGACALPKVASVGTVGQSVHDNTRTTTRCTAERQQCASGSAPRRRNGVFTFGGKKSGSPRILENVALSRPPRGGGGPNAAFLRVRAERPPLRVRVSVRLCLSPSLAALLDRRNVLTRSDAQHS